MRKGHPTRAIADQQKTQSRANLFLIAIMLPAALALLGTVTTSLWAWSHWGTVIAWSVAVLVYAAIWFRAIPPHESAIALTVENMDLEHRCAMLEADLLRADKWVAHSVSADVLRSMTTAYVMSGLSGRPEFEEALNEMLAPLYLAGEEMFDFGPGERWTFAVFLYSGEEDQLFPVWKRTSVNYPRSGASRSWRRGQGHVGKAFADSRPIITGDAAHPDVVQLAGAPSHLRRAADEELFRSFASIPFGAVNEQDAPLGVLVGTSDRKDRFDEDSARLLAHYAESIGVVMLLSDLDFDCLKPKDEALSGQMENHDGTEKTC